MTKKDQASRPRSSKKPSAKFPWWKLIASLSVLLAVVFIMLDANVRYGLNERQWQSPARVYSRALSLSAGQFLQADDLRYELTLLGYQLNSDGRRPGSYWQQGQHFSVVTRGHGEQPSQRFQLQLVNERVTGLRSAWGSALDQVSLEPVEIGSIYASHKEDRLLVQLEEVPLSLREILLLVEDRDFYSHWGLSPKAIARALIANIKAGRTVQGGSTITQQLVKNVFLSRSRSLWRKATEAVMTLLVELHYSKDKILESYINEIYLGQEGPRAIHGFALASQHYFNRPLYELNPGQIALLVGIVKGPSYYDPWRHPERAEARRDVVLKLMAQHQLITPQQSDFYQINSLGLAKPSAVAVVFPAYLDLVRRQLRRDYSEQELQTQGLQIYTAFDPIVQRHAEQSLSAVVKTLDKSTEGAVVVSDVNSGDIVALVGGREMRYAGFNRALDAVRPIGSLIKPAVYLTALEQPKRYTLVTPISDSPVAVEGGDGSLWQPQNFDRKSHGSVLLHNALAQSYNQATARLGMQLGIEPVLNMVERLGVSRKLPAVPALLLGAGELSPLEVAQMYQTIASHGVNRPLRAITQISDQQGKTLARYPVQSQPVVDAAVMHLLHYSMMEVVREGTGKTVYQRLREDFAVAGKTGSTNDLRDSWFAGFAGDYLAVVWMGRDDNQSAGITGAGGALKVWRELFSRVSRQPINLEPPAGVTYHWVDSDSGLLSSGPCDNARYVPFLQGSAPQQKAPCSTSVKGVLQWFRELF
ncbi:penicillin-binding protein 1B [Dasania marina]|uniref:penicillin-binding protein 1B n=1 Tax=Dasania marina TaxID=471499 RepID=UPI0030D8884A|tara:strand:+ start:21043 stop:23313 length:2271 start_codon:yes stop_codon:yes gene_type:complete